MASQKLRIGHVEILDLTDGACLFPLNQVFAGVSAEQWAPYRRRFPDAFAGDDAWNAHIGGFLLRSRGRTLLVDTGVGPNPAPALFGDMKGRLMDELAANGVVPEDVDTVFITHVHPDHVGWNLMESGQARFPRARYLVSQADWDALPRIQAVMPPYVDQTLTPLQTLGILDLLDGETPLTEEVSALPAPGHTPGHMVLLVNSGGEKAMIMGDALTHPAQVGEPDWVFSGDFDAAVGIATRKPLLDRIEAEGMTLIQCHFPAPGYGRIVRLEGRRFWQARFTGQ